MSVSDEMFDISMKFTRQMKQSPKVEKYTKPASYFIREKSVGKTIKFDESGSPVHDMEMVNLADGVKLTIRYPFTMNGTSVKSYVIALRITEEKFKADKHDAAVVKTRDEYIEDLKTYLMDNEEMEIDGNTITITEDKLQVEYKSFRGTVPSNKYIPCGLDYSRPTKQYDGEPVNHIYPKRAVMGAKPFDYFQINFEV